MPMSEIMVRIINTVRRFGTPVIAIQDSKSDL
jgi:hypothetical protein